MKSATVLKREFKENEQAKHLMAKKLYDENPDEFFFLRAWVEPMPQEKVMSNSMGAYGPIRF